MIKINKGDAPPILEKIGADLQLLLEVNYDFYIVEIKKGEIKFEFTDDYHSSEVKDTLSVRQHDKCCFSEAKFVGDFFNVEHFRPKGRVDIIETKQKILPGYYWLGYSWSNLFLCKQVINISYKKNFFPLLKEVNRNRDHHDTNIESPVLIDPSTDEPRDHIRFEMDEPVHRSERGRITIELLGLRDPQFARARRTLLKYLKGLKDVTNTLIECLKNEGAELNLPELQQSIQLLKDAMQPEAEFSSMAIDFLQDWPPLQLALHLPESS